MKAEYLITEWNHSIGTVVKSGEQWEVTDLATVSEIQMWGYVHQTLAKVAASEKTPHYSVKRLIPKMTTRSIKGTKE